jgi:hypothetical protein
MVQMYDEVWCKKYFPFDSNQIMRSDKLTERENMGQVGIIISLIASPYPLL